MPALCYLSTAALEALRDNEVEKRVVLSGFGMGNALSSLVISVNDPIERYFLNNAFDFLSGIISFPQIWKVVQLKEKKNN
uniref:ACP_syn_III_C domain-containing protein n=1 Tax=Ascaris lumbricoides TaxID=6252 RepID=A0A0M3ILA7_ASCLU